MKEYKSFDLLKKISFERTSASENEFKALNILKDEIVGLGCDKVEIEEFNVDHSDILKERLYFPEFDLEIECKGIGMSGSTIDGGILKEFIYIPSLEDAKMSDCENKICLVHGKMINSKIYEELCKQKASGIITTTGSLYKEKEDVDLDPYYLREKHYKYGQIPGVCIRIKDAEKILRLNPKEVLLEVKQNETHEAKSHNLIATIKGIKKENEIVCFSAHYDSVSFSNGAYDNATGSTTLMQLLDYYLKNKPDRTLKFIWCGSEECGLLGSKAYTNVHKEELDKYLLNINVDMIGVTLGNDICVCTSENGLVEYIKYYSKILGFPISVKQGVYSSDSTPFADNNVPAISLARLSPTGGAEIHSHNDVLDYLSEPNYYKTIDFYISLSKELINSKCFPVTKSIPDNMKDEIDYYYLRKERK